jgi:hypothetical protein
MVCRQANDRRSISCWCGDSRSRLKYRSADPRPQRPVRGCSHNSSAAKRDSLVERAARPPKASTLPSGPWGGDDATGHESIGRRRRRDIRVPLVRVARTALVVQTFADVFVAPVPSILCIIWQIPRRFSHCCLLFHQQRAATERVSSCNRRRRMTQGRSTLHPRHDNPLSGPFPTLPWERAGRGTFGHAACCPDAGERGVNIDADRPDT